jgi:hypothetical protein
MAAPCWADAERTSAVLTDGATGAPLATSAHLDFRITVLPALSLRSDARGQWLASSNSGPLVVQGAASAAAPSALSSPSASRAAARRGPLAAMAVQAEPDATGRARITIASP